MISYLESDKNRMVAVLNGEIPDRVPLFEHVIDNRYIRHVMGVEKAGTLQLDPENHLRLMEHIGMDVATFGYKWQIKNLQSSEILDGTPEPDFSWFLEKVDRYLEVLKDTNVGLNVYVHGPLDVTYLSIGYEDFFYAIHDDIDFVEAVMEKFTRHTIRLVNELVKKNLTMIYVADDVAFGQGLMIRPELFKKLWLPRMQRIVEPIHERKLPCVYHSDGKTDEFLPMVIDLGFKGVTAMEPQCNDIFAIKKKFGKNITLFGNMDVAGSLAFGTPQDVVADIKKLLKGLMPGGRYVAMSGNSITDGVIPENYQAMIETVKEYGRYR